MADATFENNLPEMEETAPAPASALGTVQTSNEVTIDITTPHGDAQSITETNNTESPVEDDGPSAPRPTSAEEEHPKATCEYKQQLREGVISHLIGRRRPGYVLKVVDK